MDADDGGGWQYMKTKEWLGDVGSDADLQGRFVHDAEYVRRTYTEIFEMAPGTLVIEDKRSAEDPDVILRTLKATPALKVPKFITKALGGIPPYTEHMVINTRTRHTKVRAVPGGVPITVEIEYSIFEAPAPLPKGKAERAAAKANRCAASSSWMESNMRVQVRIPVVGKLIGLFIKGTSKKYLRAMRGFIEGYHAPGGGAEQNQAAFEANRAAGKGAFESGAVAEAGRDAALGSMRRVESHELLLFPEDEEDEGAPWGPNAPHAVEAAPFAAPAAAVTLMAPKQARSFWTSCLCAPQVSAPHVSRVQVA